MDSFDYFRGNEKLVNNIRENKQNYSNQIQI